MADNYHKAPYPIRGRIIENDPARPWEAKKSLDTKAIGELIAKTVRGHQEHVKAEKEDIKVPVPDIPKIPVFPVAPEGTEYTYLPFETEKVVRMSQTAQICAYTQIPIKVKWVWIQPLDGVMLRTIRFGNQAGGVAYGSFDTSFFRIACLPVFGDVDVGNVGMIELENWSGYDYKPSAIMIGLVVHRPMKGRW